MDAEMLQASLNFGASIMLGTPIIFPCQRPKRGREYAAPVFPVSTSKTGAAYSRRRIATRWAMDSCSLGSGWRCLLFTRSAMLSFGNATIDGDGSTCSWSASSFSTLGNSTGSSTLGGSALWVVSVLGGTDGKFCTLGRCCDTGLRLLTTGSGWVMECVGGASVVSIRCSASRCAEPLTFVMPWIACIRSW